MANDIQLLSEQIFGLTIAFEAFTKNSESRNAYEEFAYGQGVSKYDNRLTTSFPKVDAKISNPAIGEVPIFKTDINAKEVCFSFNQGGELGEILYQSNFSSGVDGWLASNSTVSAPTAANADGAGLPLQSNSLKITSVTRNEVNPAFLVPLFSYASKYRIKFNLQTTAASSLIGTGIRFEIYGSPYTQVLTSSNLVEGINKITIDFTVNVSTVTAIRLGRPIAVAAGQINYLLNFSLQSLNALIVQNFTQYLFVQTGFHQREIETNLVGKNIKHLKGYLLPVNLDGYNFPINAPFLSIVNIGIDSNGFVTSQNQPYYENSPNLYSAQFNGF